MKRTFGMMTLWVMVLTGVVAPSTASAQTVGLGYAFGAPGFTSCCGESVATLHAGAGGEAILADGIGIGADVGFLGPMRSMSDGVGLLSVNGSYHFARIGRDHRAQPFVTTGYSLAFRNGHLNLWNVGGGADYWITPAVGLRMEVRDHIGSEFGSILHLWGPRIGVVIRSR